MANMEVITSVTVGSGGAASVTLTAIGTIPQTYTDLKVLISARSDEAGGTAQSTVFVMSINGVTTDRTFRNVIGYQGTSLASQSLTGGTIGTIPGAAVTASTFNNFEVYIPNYTLSNYKSFSVDGVTENNNASNNELRLTAGLWSQTAAITTLGFTLTGGNIVEGSTFYLYGISNVTSTAKATGGIVSSDETYWYHMFPYSSTFTPTTAISADVLCIAGGGGGATARYGNSAGGGGGAGGLVALTSQSLSATAYSVTVGAGGVRGTASVTATQGGNSQFASTTAAVGGGRGAGYNGGFYASGTGGSGGGGQGFAENSGTTSGAAGTAGQGNTGGSSIYNYPTYLNYASGGGGGAGAVGQDAQTQYQSGNGGNGSNAYSSWASATTTGDQGYYAGGGGGGGYSNSPLVVGGNGGLGGGGDGEYSSSFSTFAGATNTGGGGAGGSTNSTTSGAGGSGLVIVRYAK